MLNMQKAEHVRVGFAVFTEEATACDFCAHIERPEHGKLRWCLPCKKEGRLVGYCGAFVNCPQRLCLDSTCEGALTTLRTQAVPESGLEAAAQGIMWKILSIRASGLKSKASLE